MMPRDAFDRETQRMINAQHAYARDGVMAVICLSVCLFGAAFLYSNFVKGDASEQVIDKKLNNILSDFSRASKYSIRPAIINVDDYMMLDKVDEKMREADFALCFMVVHDYLKFSPRAPHNHNKYGQYDYVQVLKDEYTGAKFSGIEKIYARTKQKCESIDRDVSNFDNVLISPSIAHQRMAYYR